MNAQIDPTLLMADRFAVGQPVSRKEDPVLLRGMGRYTDDLNLPGQLYGVMVRSRVAHGTLRSLDIEPARDMPGVHLIVTAADLKRGGIKTMPAAAAKNRDGTPTPRPPQPALATNRVRYVGDPIAMVVAETIAQAKDAAEAVFADIDPLPAVTTASEAAAPDAPQLHDDAPGNVCLDYHYGDSEQVPVPISAFTSWMWSNGCGTASVPAGSGCAGAVRAQGSPRNVGGNHVRHGETQGDGEFEHTQCGDCMIPNIDLSRRVALVTGASRGIGRAVALALASTGAAVAVNYRERAKDADDVVAKIRASGGRAIAVQADVSLRKPIDAMRARTEQELGPVDILINNAGIAVVRGLDDLTEDEFDQTILVNLKSAFLCVSAVLPGMRARGWGRIVNVSSGAARGAGAIGVHYNASKAGLEGLTRGYAARLAKEGITVNAIAPSLIATDMIGPLSDAASRIPMGRLGTPEEVAAAVLMVITNGYMTGQTVQLNGACILCDE